MCVPYVCMSVCGELRRIFVYLHARVSLFIYIYHIAKISNVCVRGCVSVCVRECVCFAFVTPAWITEYTHSLTHPLTHGGVPSKVSQLNMDNWYYNLPDKHIVYIMYDPSRHTHTHTHSDSMRDIHSALVIAT